jgi:hypothetical protein
MFGQLDTVIHPDVGRRLLLVMATAIAPAASADDTALVPLMTADGIGNARLVVLFVDHYMEGYLPRSLQL